ncbi:hypothetical protein [Amycolatopsis sp. FDAARGOS 1241]|uniref:hypothetical protein n=1 Tax=Amycolatopsis sp. FDAARGOS 1241 TaxID=2778070 RepID=UPI001950E7FB|nr:hypothetical protein [Amycolatopsis sp. FDAARGOS 1241]QRP47257.1 hypothetical protein I6J71_04420 [Amycolatopsis sp. FDAARGOS 1241]
MAEAISDRHLVAVLRPFVRACAPVLDALREADPFGLRARADQEKLDAGAKKKVLDALTSVKVPGTAAWGAMDIDQRAGWWINRVGTLTAALTSIPGLGGALADRLPVQDALGAASQGLLLCAIAGEYGVTDVGSRVRLIAAVLFDRDVDPVLAGGKNADESAEDSEAARLTEELTESERTRGKVTVRAVAGTLWRLGRSLLSLSDELEKRPRGRFYHRALGLVPVVGAAGDYFGERSGLKVVWKRAHEWLMANSFWAR